MRVKRSFSRRRFIAAALGTVATAVAAEGFIFEPQRLKITSVRLTEQPQHRFVAWSDFHFNGDVEYAEKIVATINGLLPDFVCFLGDIVDKKKYHTGALQFITKIRAPVYGVPGNHDSMSGSRIADYHKVFRATGGSWLVNQIVRPLGEYLELCGSAERYVGFIPLTSSRLRVLLSHYPMTANQTFGRTFAGVLAGHSHGGQVRLPGYGALALPRHVGRYELGRFATPAGPLWVTAGVGTLHLPVRFNCPPELLVVEI